MADVGYQMSALRPAAQAAGGSVGDFLALMKPRVMSLVVFTALVGMVLAPGSMVRRRHRRAHAAHRRAAHTARSRHAG